MQAPTTPTQAAPPSLPYPHRSSAAALAARLISGLLALVLALVLITNLTACGGGGDDGSPDTPTPSVDCKANPGACK